MSTKPKQDQREYKKEYRQRNRAKLNAYARQWRAANSEHWKKLVKKSRTKHIDKNREGRRKYYWAHRSEVLAGVSKLRNKILDMFGRKCMWCGFSDVRALQVDHKNGGGRDDVSSFKSRYSYYKHVLKVGAKKYQLLCANCNWIKRVERGESRGWKRRRRAKKGAT